MASTSLPGQAPSTVNDPVYWPAHRADVRTWLRDNAPSIAELYEGAVYLVFGPPIPGHVRFVAHAVREIRNRLPSIISPPVNGGRLDYPTRLDKITDSWRRNGLLTDTTSVNLGFGTSQGTPSPDITIPRPLFHQIASLLRDHQVARTRTSEAAVGLFQARMPQDQFVLETVLPVVNQWLAVTEWFMGRAHDNGDIDAVHADQVQAQFELFESFLGALSRSFYDTLEEIDAILADANA